MGFSFEKNIELYIPNATKCWTWQDVKKSHMIDDQKVVIQLEDIHGLIILLVVGLGGAIAILTVELITKALKQDIKNVAPDLESLGNFISFQILYVNLHECSNHRNRSKCPCYSGAAKSLFWPWTKWWQYTQYPLQESEETQSSFEEKLGKEGVGK